MDTMRLATIGTSVITDALIEAVSLTEGIELVATYSRTEESARAFAERHSAALAFSSLNELAASSEVDAVYLASPNAIHFEQALACVRAGKHVLVEKPLCARRQDAEALFAAAHESGVVALEAMRPMHDPAWIAVSRALAAGELGRVRRASFRFGKYSSRYDEVLAGRQTNIFDARMATGALMDIGIYCVEPAAALFGMPSRIMAAPALVASAENEPTGGVIDGAGSVLCCYDEGSAAAGLVVELAYSKISQDLLPSQIEGELGTITLDAMSAPQLVTLTRRGMPDRAALTTKAAGGSCEQLSASTCANNMVYELANFVRLVRGENVPTPWGELAAPVALERYESCSLTALAICDEVRAQAGIVFLGE